MSSANLLSVPPELLSPILKYVVEGERKLGCRLVCNEIKDVVDLHVIPYLWRKLKENAGQITAIDLKGYITQIETNSPDEISLASFRALYQKILTVYPLKYMPIMFPPFLKMQSNLDKSLVTAWPKIQCRLPNSNGLISAQQIRSYFNNTENEQSLCSITQLQFNSLALKFIPLEIYKFKEVTDVNLSANILKSLPDLSSLSKVKKLNISLNKITSNQELSKLTNLESLNFGENDIDSLTSLSHLTDLTNLDLNDNKIPNIEVLSKLTKLITLNLSKNMIPSIEDLCALTNLEVLQFSKNQVTSLVCLSALTNLGGLQIYSNQIASVEPMTNLINLERLDIGHNQITSLQGLTNLTKLERLWIRGNQILPEESEKLAETLKNTKIEK